MIAVRQPKCIEFLPLAGLTCTRAQHILVACAFDRAQPADLTSDADIEIATKLFGSLEPVPASAFDVIALVAGARGGKSRMCAVAMLWKGLTCDLSGLAPGEQGVGIFCAPSIALARIGLRYVLGAAQTVPGLQIETSGVDSFSVRRPDGKLIRFVALPASQSGTSLRGQSIFFALFDEAAFFRSDEMYQVSDNDLFAAVSPRMIVGGTICIASTPWVQEGLIWKLHEANYGHPTTALAILAPTTLLRDDAKTLAMVLREKIRDPENCAREYFCEWLPSGARGFFDADQVAEAVHLGVTTAPEPGEVFCGADYAFRGDASSQVIVSKSPDGVVRVLDVIEIKPTKAAPLSPSDVIQQFSARMRKHGVSVVCADSHNREAITELLAKENVQFVLGPSSQRDIGESYSLLRLILQEGKLRLPDNPSLRRQLLETIGKTSAGGSLQIIHPRRAGSHGDIVSALANASHMARRSRGNQDALSMGLRRSAQVQTRPGELIDECGERDRDEDERRTDQHGNDGYVAGYGRRFHY